MNERESSAFWTGVLATLVVALVVVAAFTMGRVSHAANACYEDEVYAVIEDHNPNRGLSWHCITLDNLND